MATTKKSDALKLNAFQQELYDEHITMATGEFVQMFCRTTNYLQSIYLGEIEDEPVNILVEYVHFDKDYKNTGDLSEAKHIRYYIYEDYHGTVHRATGLLEVNKLIDTIRAHFEWVKAIDLEWEAERLQTKVKSIKPAKKAA